MIKDILPGFRSLKSSLLTGIMILITVYLWIYKKCGFINIPEAITYLLELYDLVPMTLIAIAAALTGSLYTTGLEGIVDWIYRKNIQSMLVKKKNIKIWSQIRWNFMPFSEAAYDRIEIALKKFYWEKQEDIKGGNLRNVIVLELDEQGFIAQNLKEILWMDGRLVGTPLNDTYMQFRSEGESRLSISILLPMVVIVICDTFEADAVITGIICAVFLGIAVKLAEYGLYYYRRSNSFLAHHIAGGEIYTATMEDIVKKNKVIPKQMLAKKGKNF